MIGERLRQTIESMASSCLFIPLRMQLTGNISCVKTTDPFARSNRHTVKTGEAASEESVTKQIEVAYLLGATGKGISTCNYNVQAYV